MKGFNMVKSLVVYGPQGSGKSNYAEVIARRMGLGRIVEEYSRYSREKLETHGVLYMTSDVDVVPVVMSKGIDIVDIRVAKSLVIRPTTSKRKRFKAEGMAMFRGSNQDTVVFDDLGPDHNSHYLGV